MYSIFEMLCKKNGVTPYKVAKDTGISTATLTSWKQGKYAPKADKRKMIADYFGVSLEYLDTGEDEPAYYLNPETAKLAQEMFEDKEMRALFDMKRNMNPEVFRAHYDMMKKLYELENPTNETGC